MRIVAGEKSCSPIRNVFPSTADGSKGRSRREGEGDDYEETFGRHSQIFFGPVFNLHLKIFYP